MAQIALEVETLSRLVAHHIGVAPEVVRLGRIPTGRFNTSYLIEGGPVSLVLRIAPPDDRLRMLFYEHRMMRQEPGLHRLLLEQTDVPVPAIVAHDFGHAKIDRDYLLVERFPGAPLSQLHGHGPGQIADLLRDVGRCLRQVHVISGDRYGYVGDRRPMEPQADWPSAFRTMWHNMLDDIERCGGYSPAEATEMRRRLDRHMRVFDRPVSASLLHMDVWAENILADDRGGLTGLIDWDRALWGDPEIEFAVLDYCGISEPPFWEGYGIQRDQSAEARIRRVFY